MVVLSRKADALFRPEPAHHGQILLEPRGPLGGADAERRVGKHRYADTDSEPFARFYFDCLTDTDANTDALAKP